MSKLLITEAEIENDALTPEASDEALIAAARDLNESYNGHLRRSIEDFWRLGEKLVWLFDRPRPDTLWADILRQIGISTTTDSNARRLYHRCPFGELSQYKNKTEALRAFGILSKPPKSSSGTMKEADAPPVVESPTDNHIKALKSPITDRGAQPDVEDAPEAGDTNTVGVDDDTVEGNDASPTTVRSSQEAPYDSLKVLANIATRLEFLMSDGIDVTPDHLIHIERAMEALGRLQARGVSHAA